MSAVGGVRRVVLEGPRNFRDLGGYPTSQGGRVRWGRVFRSDGLHRLTPGDLERLAGLGIRSIYDLRGPAERAASPNPLGSISIDLYNRPADDPEPVIDRRMTPLDAEALLRDIYVKMLSTSAHLFGRLFSLLALDDALPAVFHCHAGKDRTGLAAAVLLSALGVEREVVLEDYELTSRIGSQDDPKLHELLRTSGMPAEAVDAFLGAPRWAMAEALDALDDLYGGIDAYLLGPGEMEKDVLGELRGVLSD